MKPNVKWNRTIVSAKFDLAFSVFLVIATLSTQALPANCAPNDENSRLGPENLMITEDIDIRLPTALRPVRYELHIQPMINGNFSISGNVKITMEVMEATSNVTLHILDIVTKNDTIKINSAEDPSGPGLTINKHLYDQDRDFYIAILAEELEEGKYYILTMDYEGYLSDQLAGFYRSQYKNAKGTHTRLAATQFEPVDARRAFPCFDEPGFKAEFDVYLARETNMTTIANMPKMETIPFDDDSDWVWDHFNTSLPMSTYLVAFVVSDFTNLNSTFNDHVLFRVWAREEAIAQAEYAREAGPVILTWYEGFFNITFPLPKQDMIALPDFSVGAMENWGLVTYRETALLYDVELSSVTNKERVATVVAHELAHQWFGDLVTMTWWTDIWLNEGFATYMEYQGVDYFEPSWRFLEEMITNELQPVFDLDCLESSHPISVPVERPEQINQIFDAISYAKGASIIRMMNHTITGDTFRNGIINYLKKYMYANAAQDDLWECLTKQGHADGTLPEELTVKLIMDPWTLQKGYPVINVVRQEDLTATVTQERFLLADNPNVNDTHDYKWWVPITFTTQDNPDFSDTEPVTWIPSTEDTITVDGMAADDKWIIFNIQQTGYYKVNYEVSNWKLLTNQLFRNPLVICDINRGQIIDDSFDLAQAGQLSYDIPLSISMYLVNETEYLPWSSALANLVYLNNMFARSSESNRMKDYILALLTPFYDGIGFEDNRDDPFRVQKERVLVLGWACNLGMSDCVQNSVDLFSKWMNDPTNLSIISPNQKQTVYCTAIAEGGDAEWEFAWHFYLNTNLGTDKDDMLSALGCTKEKWRLSWYLDAAFTPGSGIRKQDAPSAFSSVASNGIGRDLAWDYLRSNAEMLSDYLETFTAVGDMVVVVSNEFNTHEELYELLQFKEFYEDDLGSATKQIDQSIERTTNSIAWMESYYKFIVQWLRDNGYGTLAGQSPYVAEG